ncbi:MAG: ABC transporter substrate-binding protein [Gammaproteobacteria bacterium]
MTCPNIAVRRAGLLARGLRRIAVGLALCLLAACSEDSWNNPYPAAESDQAIYYDSFSGRPKHLDPITAYSADEYIFITQIYEPPLQYHFLKRPYELTTLTAAEMPTPELFDIDGNPLPADTAPDDVGYSIYRIEIRPGIEFQPHPAFARNTSGDYRYHDMQPADLEDIYALEDFEQVGSRELTSADYIYQLKRFAHPHVHSPIAGLMSKYIVGMPALAEELRNTPTGSGADPFLDLRDYELEGVREIDRYTYEIKINGKYPQFVYWLAMPFFSPMPWEADKFHSQPGMAERNITLDWYPIGTGAFMLTENNPNLRMVMERNPNFRGELYPTEGEPGDAGAGFLDDAGKPMPFIEKAVYSLEKESIPSWSKFLQGYYDVSAIASDSFDQAVQFNVQGNAELTEEMLVKGINLLTAVTTSSFYMGFNMTDPVVGGDSERARLLRRAIAIAVDFEELISIFQNGRGMPAQGPIPPGIFGHVEGEAGINPYVYDWENGEAVRKPIEEARRLLEQAGYPGGRERDTGRPLILYYDTLDRGPDSRAMHNWFVKQFDKLGIRLVVRGSDYNRFREKIRQGTAQIFMWGWNADYPDPENFLFLLHGPNAAVADTGDEGANSANYNNPEFNALFDRMKNMDNSPARQAIIDEMVDIARRDSPWLFGFHPVAYSLHHEWYKNAKPNLMANNSLKYKRIDPELRAERRAEWNEPVIWPLVLLAIVIIAALLPAIAVYRRREKSAAL